MGKILITGVSGTIGSKLAASLQESRDVLGMCRGRPPADIDCIRGNFASFEDLRALDDYDIEAVIHLAAVTGGCSERDGVLVNVEGTRCLMRYLIDRGCRKFVMASSIAVVGLQNVNFRPLSLPIADEHPCLDRDGYGVSKFLMEEIMKYYARQNPAVDAIALRLAAIVPDESPPAPAKTGPLGPWALAGLSRMKLSDAIEAFTAALAAPLQPGMRIMNAVSPWAWTCVPVADILENWYGDEVDLAHYRQPGHEYDSVFACNRIREELGFVAESSRPEAARA